MSATTKEQQMVFLAFRPLFQGKNAQIRKSKAIRNRLELRDKSSSLLIKQIGFEKVVSVLKELLESEIFASECKAKQAFPALFKTSPEQVARHEALNAGAAKEEAKVLQQVEAAQESTIEGAHAGGSKINNVNSGKNRETPAPAQSHKVSKSKEREIPAADKRLDGDGTLLYPVQFSFKVQHTILAKVQKLLEECCYEFSQKYVPLMLTEMQWDCAEAVELNTWTSTIIQQCGYLSAEPFQKLDPKLHEILLAVNKLRHSAVHRLRISTKGIIQMIDEAAKFAETLLDSVRALQLEELAQELRDKMTSQELNKNYLETKLKDELDEIERQREKLAERERQAVSKMVLEDWENMHFIGSLLEASLNKVFSRDTADVDTHECGSDRTPDNMESCGTDDESYERVSSMEPVLGLDEITSSIGAEKLTTASDAPNRVAKDKKGCASS